MGKMKRTTLASIENLKKSKDESFTKRQKSERQGKENTDVSSVAEINKPILTKTIIEVTCASCAWRRVFERPRNQYR